MKADLTYGSLASVSMRDGNIQAIRAAQETAVSVDRLAGSSRLEYLLTQLERKLLERYAFDVFAEDSINFGIMVTYRQTWEPQQYLVGDLVSTIPLAP